jgi:hypothetical protein
MSMLLETHSDRSSYAERQETIRRGELRPLTSEEACQVHLATVREGVNHVRWPREVIERFLELEM